MLEQIRSGVEMFDAIENITLDNEFTVLENDLRDDQI